MYRTLADAEFLRGLTHGRVVFNDIIRDIYNPLLNIAFHKKSPAILIVTLYAGDSFICLSNFCLFSAVLEILSVPAPVIDALEIGRAHV